MITRAETTLNPYTEEAAAIAASQHIEIPIEDQPLAFLSAVWAGQAANCVLGLSVDDKYLDKAGQPQDTMRQTWIYPSQLPDLDLNALQRSNNNTKLVSKGCGSIFWATASRKQSVWRRSPTARGTIDELV